MTDPSLLTFSSTHPGIAPLTVRTNPNSILWSYNLNTVTFPTYGGAVTQILSVNIDDIEVTGQVGSYTELEEIYKWFIRHLQISTSGRDQQSLPPGNETLGGMGYAYSEQPIDMLYPARGWTFQILPKSLPGFRYAFDSVAPEWKLVAAVYRPDTDFANLILDDNHFDLVARDLQVGTFAEVSSDLLADDWLKFSARDDSLAQNLEDPADYYLSLLPKYVRGDLGTLGSLQYSGPNLSGGTGSSTTTTKAPARNG